MPAAPNYTNAALVMGLINLFWMLTVLWITFGLPAVLLAGFVLDNLISRLSRRGRRA
jgi:short subunit fatty acids transporter